MSGKITGKTKEWEKFRRRSLKLLSKKKKTKKIKKWNPKIIDFLFFV